VASRALAIETSGRVGSIALVEAGKVVEEREFPHGLKHAAGILSIIDSMVRDRGWTPRDIEEIYVSAGPGSFTGLRIGITLAKTMAFTTDARIVAVPSARVLVENAPAEAHHAIIVLDAKRDQIFTARFERTPAGWDEREPAKLDSLAAMIERSPKPVHLLGEGIPYHEKFIPQVANVIATPPETWRARAGVVAQIGIAMAQKGEFADPFKLTPIYIRKAEAEEKADLAEQKRIEQTAHDSVRQGSPQA
jgi:tRNA threonylcarbamoyladenosine biosynthesis protein TsaB